MNIGKDWWKLRESAISIVSQSKKLSHTNLQPPSKTKSSKISPEITKSYGDIWMSKIDLDYAYGQARLSKEAAKHCVFLIIGGDFTGHYPFEKGL